MALEEGSQMRTDQPVAPPHRGVVVGVDDGASGDAALRFAAGIATALDLPVMPTHVYRGGHGGPETPLLSFGDLRLTARQTLDGAVERGRTALATVAEVSPYLTRGPVAQTLVAESRAADLLVVGRPDRGGGRMALPECSVPVHVASHARCPVAVGPADWHLDRVAGTLTVAIAAAQFSPSILHQAFRIARPLGLGVSVVHVPSASRAARQLRRRAAAERSAPMRDGAGYPLEQAVGQAAQLFPGVPARIDMVEGAPGSTLEQLSHGSAILVAGRRERPRRRRESGLGTVARHLLRTSACPVVFVDPGDRWPVTVPPAGSADLAGAPTGD
jgi:nucleotide-binding universal stress UspA family protein